MVVLYNEEKFTITNYSKLKAILTRKVGVNGFKYFDYFIFMAQMLEKSLDLLTELDLIRTLEDLYLYAPYSVRKLKEVVKEKYIAKYKDSSEKTQKALCIEAYKIFDEIFCNWERENNTLYDSKDIDGYLEHYKEALSLSSPELELVVDVNKFIPLHLSYAQAMESKWYSYQMAVIDNLNAFFNNVPITEKRLKELFRIDSLGRLEANPKGVSMEVYKNYIG